MLVCRILDNLTRRAKPIRIIGDPDSRGPDKWSFTVCLKVACSLRSNQRHFQLFSVCAEKQRRVIFIWKWL